MKNDTKLLNCDPENIGYGILKCRAHGGMMQDAGDRCTKATELPEVDLDAIERKVQGHLKVHAIFPGGIVDLTDTFSDLIAEVRRLRAVQSEDARSDWPRNPEKHLDCKAADCEYVHDALYAFAREQAKDDARPTITEGTANMDRPMLTMGEFRAATKNLHDDCHIEVSVGRDGYGDGISCEVDGDGEGAWVNIYVEPHD